MFYGKEVESLNYDNSNCIKSKAQEEREGAKTKCVMLGKAGKMSRGAQYNSIRLKLSI
jgi:hypothetical protein